MNIHNEIMNIQIDRVRMTDQLCFVSDYNTAYKLGHRDARHAAAELSLKAESRIEELELLLREAWGMVNGATEEWHNKVAEALENKQ